MERTVIPIFLGGDKEKPVGRATIDKDGDLVALVSGDLLIRHIEHLSMLGMIHGLSLDISYVSSEQKD